MTSEEIFNDQSYLGFDQVRFDNFNELNIDFKNKKILELGSGIGNHTDFLLTKKPKFIVSVEGLKENFDVLEKDSNVKNPCFVSCTTLKILLPTIGTLTGYTITGCCII